MLASAYIQLRNREANRLYGTDFKTMEAEFKKPETKSALKETLKKQIKTIREMYPMQISESELIFKS